MADPAFQQLIGLISANHDDLFRYIFSLLPHPDDARDVLQETLLELTRKFAQYDETRPFLPWAWRFAYHQVLRHRDRNPRKLTYLPPDLLELLAPSAKRRSRFWRPDSPPSTNAWAGCRRTPANWYMAGTQPGCRSNNWPTTSARVAGQYAASWNTCDARCSSASSAAAPTGRLTHDP